ncbi:MAG: DUF7452 domain-containing protein [Chitinophagales bacterium]
MLVQKAKSTFVWQFLCLLLILSSWQTNSLQAQPSTFKHKATSSNTTANYTFIDHARTNGQPKKILFVTHDYGSGPYAKSPVGVWYANGKWTIFQQNKKPLLASTKFNVLVQTTADRGVFIHKASHNNTRGHITTLDHPDTNGKPNAKLMVTQHWGSTRTYNNHPIGVYYSGGKWRIFNQDRGAMSDGAMFNILVNHPKSFQHTATSSSMSLEHVTSLNNANTNNAKDAFVFVTQYWTSVYNPHPVGVWYAAGKWTVYNEDLVKMPANSKFNVIAFSLNGGSTSIAPKVTNTKLTAVNPSVTGKCTQVIKFKGSISFNAKGTVKYRFIRSDGGTGRTESVYFAAAGTKVVSTEWHLGKSYSGWEAIEILSHNRIKSNKANFTLKCTNDASNKDLTGVFKCTDGGYYYVRQIGNKVYWFGEHPNGNFANVMSGSLNGNMIKSKWWDVPKGKARNKGNIQIKVSADKNTLTYVSATGGFGGRKWTRTTLPTNLPNKRAAQYNGSGYGNLSGAWNCNDNGTYYINDKDGEVVWVGEAKFANGQQPAWTNIFIGNCNSTTVKGIWVDVPKGRTRGSGTMTMKMENGGNTLRRTAVTGGFGGSVWNRIPAK